MCIRDSLPPIATPTIHRTLSNIIKVFLHVLFNFQSLSKQNSRSSRRDSSDNDDQPSPVEEVAGKVSDVFLLFVSRFVIFF